MPGIDRFYEMAEAARGALPSAIASVSTDVIVHVVDWPDSQMLQALGLDDPLSLTGLYDGVPLTEKSFSDQPFAPDTIWLFREPILAEWQARGTVSLERLIAHVFVHELAHHFGWSDDEIARIDPWWT